VYGKQPHEREESAFGNFGFNETSVRSIDKPQPYLNIDVVIIYYQKLTRLYPRY